MLEDADLDTAGAFLTTASSHELALQHQHHGADSATTIHTAPRDDGEYELRVCGVGEAAYFEWINQIGDPVGDVFQEIDFADVEANLAPVERHAPR